MKKQNKKSQSQIDKQIDLFIDSLEQYNKKRPNPRRREDYTYLRHFFKAFVKDQNKRAAEIISKEYAKVLQLAYKQFPMKTMWNLCIDGRVLAILAHGATAHIGSSIRIPGGMIREFIRGKDGRLMLKDNSIYAKLLTGAFTKFNTDTIAEVFDSHIGCAARMAEEQLKGRNPKDSGLFADVSHKEQMANAVVEYCKEKFGNAKTIFPIQTSFDPHTGYMYMGLGTEGAFAYAKSHGGAYIDEVLKALIKMGRIISTEELVNTPKVQKLFEQYAFPLDWQDNYVKSAKLFWERIALLKSKLTPLLEERLKLIYRHLRLRSKASEEEIDERILLLLTNAFSAYLHNQTVTKDPEHSHFYPYGLHREEGVKVSEGGYPPYDISTFVVFSFDQKNLPSSIELSTTLVRKNRLEGRVIDRWHTFADLQTFVESSVPVLVQEIVHESLEEKDWKALVQLSWDDLPENWEKLTDEEFFAYLTKKGNISYILMRTINNLRKRMAILYEPAHTTSSHLVEHYKVALPILVDRYRKQWSIVPFVKLGFE